MKDIILFWMQWCWKGTQARILQEKFWYQIVEMWRILRDSQNDNSDLWQLVKEIVNQWKYLPDDIIEKVFRQYLSNSLDLNKPFILDWVVRSLWQYEFTKKILNELNRDYISIYMEISEEEAVNRLLNRKTCKNCWAVYSGELEKCKKCDWELYVREDETLDKIKSRISEYKLKTLPVIDLLKEESKMHIINAQQDVWLVTLEIENIVNNK